MDVLVRIRELAAKNFLAEPVELTREKRLDELGLDSMTLIEFMFQIQDEFGIDVPEDELKDVKTIGELEARVSAALAASGKS